MHGYDTYDYGARGYNPSYGRFTTVDPHAEKYYSISPYAYCEGNPVNMIDPNGMDATDPTPATDNKTAIDNTANKVPVKFEPVKKTTNTNTPVIKTAGGNIKRDCTVTAKQTTPITQNTLIKVDVSTTTELQKGNNNVEVIQNARTTNQEAEVTTNYGVKVNVPTHGGPVLSGVGTTSMGVDGNSVIIDFSTKIPGTTAGFGITFSVNTNDILPVLVPVVNALESEAEPLMQVLAPVGL